MHLLFYADGADFGGHEIATLRALRQLVRLPELRVTFMSHASNSRLSASLEELRSEGRPLERVPAPYVTRSVQGVRTQLSRKAVAEIARRFQAIAPDIIVPVQGSIEIGSLGILAARKAGIDAFSYIPYGHTLRQTGAPLALLRDALNRRLYRLPQGFITCCQSDMKSLQANGVVAPIEVVYHSANPPTSALMSKQEARRRLDLKPDSYIAAMVGRIYIKQKGHDFLIDTLSRYRDRLGNLTLLIVGDGPDKERVREMVRRSNVADLVRFVPWCENLSTVYSAIDLLVLPSHYEGLPNTMLEALQARVPVIASDRDGMAEVLPPEWRFATGAAPALIATLLHVKCQETAPQLNQLQLRIATQFDLQTFGARFLAALSRLSGKV